MESTSQYSKWLSDFEILLSTFEFLKAKHCWSINFFTFEVTGDLKTASSFLHETKRRAWQSYTFEPRPCQIARVLSMLKVMTNVFHGFDKITVFP